MIRPFTCLSVLLAAGSGLYLYSEKHRTTLLDDRIRMVVDDTHRIEDRTSMLRAEWALLNQPDRLQTLAAKFLPGLQPIAPTQFVQMADLDKHLPPVGEPPKPAAPAAPGVAMPAAPPPPVALASAVTTVPMPATSPVLAERAPAHVAATELAVRMPDTHAAESHAPVRVAAVQAPRHLALHLAGLAPSHTAAPVHHRMMVASAAPRPREIDPVREAAYVPRPAPYAAWHPVAAPSAPAYSGSALGMAGGASIAPPMASQ